jgi:carboxylesterase type B
MVVNLTKLPLAQQLAAKALLESGKSERQTAKLSKISREAVRAIKECKSLDPEQVDRIKKGLAAKFYDVADRSIDNITDDKLKNAQPSQLIMTAGIATDKARLIEGKATSRTEYVDASDQELNDEIARLEGELTGWKDGSIVNGEAVPGIEEEQSTSAGLQAVQTVEAAE